jgi:hypothetical protein
MTTQAVTNQNNKIQKLKYKMKNSGLPAKPILCKSPQAILLIFSPPKAFSINRGTA